MSRAVGTKWCPSQTKNPVNNLCLTPNATSGGAAVTTIDSQYDPQVEFLEVSVAINGVRTWEVHGPDLNGSYGGLQGIGGLEATIAESTGTTQTAVNDSFGNVVGHVSSGSFAWHAPQAGSYGLLPGSNALTLDGSNPAIETLVWRSRRLDPTGFYYMGARYYEPQSGRFISADPLGHGSSMSLYDYCNGDPVNGLDPDGRVAKPAWNGAMAATGWSLDIVESAFYGTLSGAASLAATVDRELQFSARTGLGLSYELDGLSDHLAAQMKPYERAGLYRNNDYTAAIQDTASLVGPMFVGKIPTSAPAAMVRTGIAEDLTLTRAEMAYSERPLLTQPTVTFRSGFSLEEVPGRVGINIPGRLTDEEMLSISKKLNDIEIAQIYKIGPGKNGGGGTYWLYSGEDSAVSVPIGPQYRYINHVHPDGSIFPSYDDTLIMQSLRQIGNPQRSSIILPAGGNPVKFNANGVVH